MSYTCQIYQINKSQALDLLNRVTERLIAEGNQASEPDEGRFEAVNTPGDLYRQIEEKRTEFAEMTIDLATLASLLSNFDDKKWSPERAAEYFARYFSNYGTASSDFLLAAGYTLRECDQLLRTCVHDVIVHDEVCQTCEAK